MQRALLIAAFLGVLTLPEPARACATCGCGDPTLTSMGTEQPYQGRLRFSSLARAYALGVGDPGQGASLTRELRFDLGIAYAPRDWLFIALQIPIQAREVISDNLSRESAWGLGEMELTARVSAWRDRAFAPHHLVSMVGGLKLPTSLLQRDHAGNPLSIDAQLGSGSVDPIAGIAYSGFYSPLWSFFMSATGYFPTQGRLGFRGGAAVRTTVAAQFQPIPQVAFRLAVDGRLEAPNVIDGVEDPNTGGFLGFLSPDVLWSPRPDLLVMAGVRVPVMDFIRGSFRQSPIVSLAVAWDR